MADIDIINRIKFLMKELNYRQVEFASKIGVDTSNLSKYLNGRLPISEAFINRLVVNLGVSKQWLEDGTDIPFAKAAAPAATSTLAVTDHQGTPVYDIDVTAGPAPRSLMFTEDHIIDWMRLPGTTPDDRIVIVSGNSMAPVIKDGDMIVLRELTNTQYIMWGHVHVVILDDYRMLKYVRRHPDPTMVTLHSANPEYDDMEIRRADIRNMMLVQQIIHIEKLV